MSNTPMLPGFEDLAPKTSKTSKTPKPGGRRKQPQTKSSATATGAVAPLKPEGAGNDTLNDQQRAAAEASLERHCLVIAGAGSGKTKTLVARYRYLLDHRIAARRIMTVAFNKAAASELAQRLTQVSGRKPLVNGTFHSLGYRLLQRIKDRFDLGKEIAVLEPKEITRMVRAHVRALDADGLIAETALAVSAIEGWKNRGLTVSEARREAAALPAQPGDEAAQIYRDLHLLYAEVYHAYEAEKATLQRIDFADMLLMPVVAMREDGATRRLFARELSHILCDEYQDVNDCQYEFLQLLASEGARMFCVGDDFQAIYGWRSARIEHILNFRAEHPDATLVTLTINYRCTPEILAAANRISAGLGEKLADKDLTAHKESGATPICGTFQHRGEEAASVGTEIARRQAAGARWRDMAVLSRTNRNLRACEDDLTRRRVPYVVAGGSFWERPEILDMLAYIEAIMDPVADDAFLRIINTPSRYIGARAVEQLRRAARSAGVPCQSPSALAGLTGRAARNAEGLIDLLATARQRMHGGEPLSAILADLVNRINYSAHWRKDPETLIERMENVQELIAASDDFGTPEELLRHARHCRDQARSKTKDAVTLSTIHRAKGLEWDSVFLIACEYGVMPHYLAATPGEIDEERRLCYVALTRAARHLFVSFTWGVRGEAGPSDFLTEIAHLLDIRDGFDKPANDTGDWHSDPAQSDPAHSPGRSPAVPPWARTLEVSLEDPLDRCEAAYRRLAKACHPDLGGNPAQMRELNLAIEMARAHHAQRQQRRAA